MTNLSNNNMELELQPIFLKKKKRKRPKEINSELRAINSFNLRTKEIDTDATKHNVISNNPETRKSKEESFNILNLAEERKFQNTDAKDLHTSVSKSMNVIVDIHQEYKGNKHDDKGIKINDTLNKKTVITSSRESRSFEILSEGKTLHDQRSEINNKNAKQNHNETETMDSLNLIEEFQESPTNKKSATEFETTTKSKAIKKNTDPSFIEEKSHTRKQWNVSKNQIEEQKKPLRKRWLKDTSVICLPEMKSASWTTSRTKNPSPFIQKSEQSLLVKQSPLKQKLFFNNPAFNLENEDILKIETDHNQGDTRIEMKEINELEKPELPSPFIQSSLDSSNGREIFEETVGNSNKFKDISCIQNQKHNYDDASLKSGTSFGSVNKKVDLNECYKRVSDNAVISQNLSEDMKQSKYCSSEDTLIKIDKSVTNRKVKRKYMKHFAKGQSFSNSCTVSTTEDDDYSKGVDTENKLKKSNVKQKKVSATKPKHTSHNYTEEDLESKKKKEVKYISITIHKADILEIDYITKSPMVKVHIVNAETGKYLKSEDNTNMYLQPIITGKCNFIENKSIIPIWEEELIFEHDFNALLKIDNEQAVILFEIVDLLNFSEASFNYDKFGREGCWYKIAWAFLKPVGKSNILHLNKKVRLQLYKPQKSLRKFSRSHRCDVYTWWKTNYREKYPSSLFVSITSIDPPKLEPVFYQQLSLYDLSDVHTVSKKSSTHTLDSIHLPKWTRLDAQSCKIPNESIFETDISENGCFFVAFSNNGKYLACTFSEEHDYPIIVYKVKEKGIYTRLLGHKTFIYSLHWSNNDNYLLSVSSDQTACIWDVQNKIIQQIDMMPHPSYVYCGKFNPENASVVATGCYDRIARIWIQRRKSKKYDLNQELEGHEGFINSMCFQKNSNLLTADSVGVIIIWAVKETRGIPYRKEWHILRKIKVKDIDGIIINAIILHPIESRLLVHSRNNGLKMLDLTSGVILQKYNGLNNQRIQSAACISPCGGLIFCGNENSSLNVWHLETGNLIAQYVLNQCFRAVTSVDYHPYDHVLAFSTFGSPAPVRVLRFNKDVSGEKVGLKLLAETEIKVSGDDSCVKLLNMSLGSKRRSQRSTESLQEVSKEKNLQSSQSYNATRYESLENTLTNKDNKYDVKEKFQFLNITEQTIKSRSANRLHNIIEKIDRILINTSRSSGDVESGRNLIIDSDRNKNKNLIVQDQNVKEKQIKLGKVQSVAYLSTENYLNSYEAESSTTSTSVNKQEMFELKVLQNINVNDCSTGKRSKSASEIRESNLSKDNAGKNFSDNFTKDHRDVKDNNRFMKTMQNRRTKSSLITQPKANNLESTISYRNDSFNMDSSTDSAGTYVVEKSDINLKGNENLQEIFDTEDFIQSNTRNNSDITKRSESESSLVSNATFTIEHEVPVS